MNPQTKKREVMMPNAKRFVPPPAPDAESKEWEGVREEGMDAIVRGVRAESEL
jgi:hypothetical protein